LQVDGRYNFSLANTAFPPGLLLRTMANLLAGPV
jgi:hypothetical protein